MIDTYLAQLVLRNPEHALQPTHILTQLVLGTCRSHACNPASHTVTPTSSRSSVIGFLMRLSPALL
jgi:hypothetical protein